MQNAVIATLSGAEHCQCAVDALKRAGFTSDDISLMMPDEYGASELGFLKRTKLLQGVAIGLTLGLIVGLAFSYVAASRYIGVPEIENIFSNSPAFASLATVALCAGVAGLIGMLFGASMIEYVVKKYERRTNTSSTLMSVHVDNMTELRVAEKVLKGEGATELGIIGEDHRRRKQVKFAPAAG